MARAADPDVSVMVMKDERPPKRPKLAEETSTSVPHNFNARDRQLYETLADLPASLTPSVAHAASRLPPEMMAKLIRITHYGEHRDRMAKVFSEMNNLPKCKTCGSVSDLFLLFLFFFVSQRPLFFRSQYKTFICHKHVMTRWDTLLNIRGGCSLRLQTVRRRLEF